MLLSLPLRELLTQPLRVCRGWHESIRESTLIRQKLFYKHTKPQPGETYSLPEINPFFLEILRLRGHAHLSIKGHDTVHILFPDNHDLTRKYPAKPDPNLRRYVSDVKAVPGVRHSRRDTVFEMGICDRRRQLERSRQDEHE